MTDNNIILEMFMSIKKDLEDLKILAGKIISPEYQENKTKVPSSPKNYSRYRFNGKEYGKSRLVLAVIQKYMQDNSHLSAKELQETFKPVLQGSFGTVRTLDFVKEKNYGGKLKRYFDAPEEIIKTATVECVVCTQWAMHNIDNFINHAERLGYTIEKIED